MRILYVSGLAIAACAVAVGLFLGLRGVTSEAANSAVAPVPTGLIAHEWGTFTSFSGADGVHVGFRPNNEDLPSFVYRLQDRESKGGFLALTGLVSMETPVIYFYADKPTRATVDVRFPKGWITEWYPVAATEPVYKRQQPPGQSIRWQVQVLPGETPRYPHDGQRANREEVENPYYHARETEAAAVQAEDPRVAGHSGGVVVQREKFLFYRGVGAFAPPITVKALGGEQVKVQNSHTAAVSGAVLVESRGGKVAFAKLGAVPAKGEVVAKLPGEFVDSTELGTLLVKELTATGLYEAEAKAMVKTWRDAWFGEDGYRVLYLVPRGLTDELLPLSVEPKPTEVVRVLVGRHDFLTPEQEASVEKNVRKARAAQEVLQTAEQDIRKVGRFAEEARRWASNRIDEAARGK